MQFEMLHSVHIGLWLSSGFRWFAHIQASCARSLEKFKAFQGLLIQ